VEHGRRRRRAVQRRDWKESRYLYNESQFGVIQRTDMVTGETATFIPAAPTHTERSRPAPEPLRWNWTAPDSGVTAQSRRHLSRRQRGPSPRRCAVRRGRRSVRT
jgi:hypothetical protein